MVRARSELLAAFEAGRAIWPDVHLPFDDFAARIEELEVTREDLMARGSDLLLAIACALGDPSALRSFESVFLAGIERRVARFGLSADKVDELRQMIRVKLLVGELPGIGTYRGRAPLSAWLHVAAVRSALDIATCIPSSDMDVDLLEMEI